MALLTVDTPDTTRVFGGTPQETSVAVSQLAFRRRPGTVILANAENPLDALAALSLVHHPIDGPVLLTPPDSLDPSVRDEIARLAPTGVEGLAQVILVGSLGDAVWQEVSALGLSSARTAGMNAYHTAAEVARFLGYPTEVMLVSGSEPLSGLCAGAMAAYSGTPVLYTLSDALPQETAGAIRAAGREASVFIIGNRGVVSDSVEASVRELAHGTVSRISGEDPFDLCVRFAKYRSADTRFGFGRTERGGHAFSFVNPARWQDAISASVLAHTGKHAPILFCWGDRVPPVVREYVLQVNPAVGRREPPFMHAFIVGDFDAISASAQLDIEDAVSIDRKAACEVVHTVTPGDDLLRIARRYGVPIREIATANRLSDDRGLKPGIMLTIPYTVTGAAPPPPPEVHRAM